MSKRILLACVVLCGAQQVKAGAVEKASPAKHNWPVLYVDMQDSMLKSKQGADAQKAIEAEEKKYGEMAQKAQQEMVKVQQDMVKIKNDLDQKASMMTVDAKRAEEKKFMNQQKKLQDLQRGYEENTNEWKYELQFAMQKETDAIIKDIEVAAKELAIKNDKKAVIDAQTGRALYLHDDFNSTDELISLMNNQYDAKKKAKAPAAA